MGRTLPLVALLAALAALLVAGVAAAKKDADGAPKAEVRYEAAAERHEARAEAQQVRQEAREEAREAKQEARQEAREQQLEAVAERREARVEPPRAPPVEVPAPVAAPPPEPALAPAVVPDPTPAPVAREEKHETREERRAEPAAPLAPRDVPLEFHRIVAPPEAVAVASLPLAPPLPAAPVPDVVALPVQLQPAASAPPAVLRDMAPPVPRFVPEAPAPFPALPGPGMLAPSQVQPVVEPQRAPAPAPAPLPAMPRAGPVAPDVQPPRPLPPTPRAPLLPSMAELAPDGLWRRLGPEGWKRVFPGNAADHPVRARLLARVRASPGIHLRALARDLDLTPQNAAHHLRHLEACGLLAAAREGRRTRYFSVEGGRAVREAVVDRAFLEAQQRRRIVEELLLAPGLPARALAERLGAAETGVRWNLRRLAARGLVDESADGPRRVYAPTERGAMALEEAAAGER